MIDNLLVNLLSWHHKKQSLEVIRSDLIEHHLNVEPIVQTEWVVPDGAAEDQVINSSLFLKIGGYVENILFLVQRSCEGLTFNDAVQAELFPFVAKSDSNDCTQLFHDIIDHCGGLSVDDPLRASWKSVDLSF